MLQHNLWTDIKKRNWIGVLSDLFVVVVGVFLGLQAQQWAIARADAQKSELLKQRLVQDFELIVENLEDAINYSDLFAESAMEMYALLDHEDLPVASSQVKEQLRQAFGRHGPVPDSPTYTLMTSTGQLSLIDDADLLSALTDHARFASRASNSFTNSASRWNDYHIVVDPMIVTKVRDDGSRMTEVTSIELDLLREQRHIFLALNRMNLNLGRIYSFQKQHAEGVLDILAGEK